MAPTILRHDRYRFFFFSREEVREHVHVGCADGEAKFWLKPEIEHAKNYNLSRKRLREIEAIIEKHRDEFLTAWREHFQS